MLHLCLELVNPAQEDVMLFASHGPYVGR